MGRLPDILFPTEGKKLSGNETKTLIASGLGLLKGWGRGRGRISTAFNLTKGFADGFSSSLRYSRGHWLSSGPRIRLLSGILLPRV